MDLSNIALSVVMNHSVCEELKQLREENKILKNCIKNTNEDITKRRKLYLNLVALARSNPDDDSYQDRVDFIKSEIGEEVYEKELEKLMSEECDWTHGFNSGMLSSTRLYGDLLQYIPDVYENEETGDDEEYPIENTWRDALEEFPMLDTQKMAYDPSYNHAPKRKSILSTDETKLALKNALRYFDKKHHNVLIEEFKNELNTYGRIYMYRFRPIHKIVARPIEDYPANSIQAAAIMLMIQNNLDDAIAQHPHELITYGGNGSVFSNWAQYRLTMQYLAQMTDNQTLVMYSES